MGQKFYRNDGATDVAVGGQRARPGDELLVYDEDYKALGSAERKALTMTADRAATATPPDSTPAPTPSPAPAPAEGA